MKLGGNICNANRTFSMLYGEKKRIRGADDCRSYCGKNLEVPTV